VVCMEGKRSAYETLVGRAKGKRSLGRPRSQWEDNIKRILKKPKGVWGIWFCFSQNTAVFGVLYYQLV